jgi:hypothetical protein
MMGRMTGRLYPGGSHMADSQSSRAARDRRVHALFEATLDLEASGRAAYLEQACADEPEVRAEVEQLLLAAERARTADVLPALWSPEQAVPDPVPARPPAAVTAQGTPAPDDREHLGGETLTARLKRMGRLPLDQALLITGQTGAALAAAHDKGMVHGDLQPGNLLLVPGPDGGEEVTVLGFGNAGERPVGASARKNQRAAAANLRYMSPEQCRGIKAFDHRADIYSLATILYEMLCGRPPFTNEGPGELMAMQLMRDPPRPRALDRAIPEQIEQVVLRALAKDPRERFANMREFCAALDPAALPPDVVPAGYGRRDARQVAIVAPEPSPSMAASAASAPEARPRPGPRLALAGVLALLAVGAVVGFIAWR